MFWWTWVTVGIVLFGAELFIPSGFYLFIIGITCLVVGALTYAGFITSQNAQFLVGGALGIIQLLTIRRPMHEAMKSLGKSTGSDITHQKVKAEQNIGVGEIGKGELAGTSWNVRNESSASLQAGKLYAVEKVEGLTLIVK